MSIKHGLRALLLCLPLILGGFVGMPMRHEEIEDLMHSMNQQKIVVTIHDKSENGATLFRSCLKDTLRR